MSTPQQLANRFREVLLNGTWVANTNYKKELENLDYDKATKQLGKANTIAMLAQHIHYYIVGVKNVLEGGELKIRDAHSFDFPSIASGMDWKLFLDQLFKDVEAFAVEVENISEEKLKASFVTEEYGNYLRNIDGMIEHCYYHLGQIVLLKKLLQ